LDGSPSQSKINLSSEIIFSLNPFHAEGLGPGLDAGVAADEEAEQAPHPGLFGETAMVSGGFFFPSCCHCFIRR